MTHCDCSCSTDDFDPPSCYVERWRKARKPHKCCECHEEIPVGATYQEASGIWDGEPARFRTCKTCVAIRKDRCPNGYLFGRLRATLWECLGLDYVTGEQARWTLAEDR